MTDRRIRAVHPADPAVLYHDLLSRLRRNTRRQALTPKGPAVTQPTDVIPAVTDPPAGDATPGMPLLLDDPLLPPNTITVHLQPGQAAYAFRDDHGSVVYITDEFRNWHLVATGILPALRDTLIGLLTGIEDEMEHRKLLGRVTPRQDR